LRDGIYSLIAEKAKTGILCLFFEKRLVGGLWGSLMYFKTQWRVKMMFSGAWQIG
jgi:hypothetical protein